MEIESKKNDRAEYEATNFETIKKIAPKFAEWVSGLCPWNKADDYCAFARLSDTKAKRVSANIFTNEHRYHLYATISKADGLGTYLGCIAQTRKPRPGEDWTRGSDLPDGKYTVETWNSIKNAIIRYELKEVQKPKPGIGDEVKEVIENGNRKQS